MAGTRSNNLKLGALVVVGTVLLITGLYLLGNKRDLFSRTIEVEAVFREVSGLREGNNVRYAGIDVGTVKVLEINSDTTVVVRMVLREEAARYISTTARAHIASDGLMGSKLVSIDPGQGGEPITPGARLSAGRGFDTDAMLRTLSGSNENLNAITADLREMTRRMNDAEGPLAVFNDTLAAHDVRYFLHDLRTAASNARSITDRLDAVMAGMEQGRGALGVLTADPVAEQQVQAMIADLEQAADPLRRASVQLARFTEALNDTTGTVGLLTSDPATAADLRRILANLDSSAVLLNEDLKALQRNFLLRRYFKERKREGR
jgi:phospholipid/cholesterol/gamma-HCH transport system substrate-binding protein